MGAPRPGGQGPGAHRRCIIMTTTPHPPRPRPWLALTLLLLSALAFLYSLQVRRRDWSPQPAPLLTRLIPPPQLHL